MFEFFLCFGMYKFYMPIKKQSAQWLTVFSLSWRSNDRCITSYFHQQLLRVDMCYLFFYVHLNYV